MESLITSNVVDAESLPATGDQVSPSWQGPLFLVGMWRSGTSLLYALLNKHPQVALMYEGDLPLLGPLFWIGRAESGWLRRWEFWNQGLKRHGLDANCLWGKVSGMAAAAEQSYREYARKAGAVIGGEKSPNYFDCLTRLSRDFPNARFIVIWRDPAAICRSVVRAAEQEHSWFDRRGMTLRVLMGMKAMRVECDRMVRNGIRLHEVQYQNLVRNPVKTMEGICTFLGIPFVPDIASLSGADRTAIYEGGHHSLVKGDRIVSAVERPEVLAEDLKTKIERYLSLWWEESDGQWPPASFPRSHNAGKPSLLERRLDRFRYRSLRIFDRAVILIYCFAPLWLLGRFRAFTRKRKEARAKIKRAPHPSSIEPDRINASRSR